MSSDAQSPRTGLLAAISNFVSSYFGVWQAFSHAARYLGATVVSGIRSGDLSRLRNARDESFAKWFHDVGHNFAAYEDTTPVPRLVASAHGVVLELGAGIGNQLHRFDATKITHIYGVEPNTAMAGALFQRLKEVGAGNGLDKKYTPVFCGIEDDKALEAAGITEESMDCVVDIQVMCSVSDPKEAAKQLYRLLKPGGELLFWEHTRSNEFVARWAQWGWSTVWPHVIGGCRLDVLVKDALLEAGEWEIVDIEIDEPPRSLMPRVSGRLVKPKTSST